METYTINAQGKRLGRVASEAAHVLMGKHQPDFQRHKVADVSVEIINADKLAIDIRKAESKIYTRYTGYPGGLRTETLARLSKRRGVAEVMRRAVRGMLPSNKLRSRILKRLSVTA